MQSKKQREPASTGRTEAKEALAKPDEDSEPFLYPGVCLAVQSTPGFLFKFI